MGNRLLQRRQVATVTVRRSWKNGLKSKVNQNYGPKVALKKQASEASAKAMSESREKAAIEAAKKAFNGIDIIVSHNGTFSSQPDGSMTAHDYSGAQGEDFWTFTPNADGTITVLSKFGSVKGGEQQIETHVVPR